MGKRREASQVTTAGLERVIILKKILAREGASPTEKLLQLEEELTDLAAG